MKFGVTIPCLDPQVVAEIAALAETKGWDGIFVWDADGSGTWIALAAAALRTSRIRLGTMVTPPSKRQPFELAADVAWVDRISHGRAGISMGLGMGGTWFSRIGYPPDRKARAQWTDASIDILTKLWAGKRVTCTTPFFALKGASLHKDYLPIQQPRVPMWMIGAWNWPRSIARALHCDGIIVEHLDKRKRRHDLTPGLIAEVRDHIHKTRTAKTPFDIVIEGRESSDVSRKTAGTVVRPYAEAGATWWTEAVWKRWYSAGVEGMRKRIVQGPPTL